MGHLYPELEARNFLQNERYEVRSSEIFHCLPFIHYIYFSKWIWKTIVISPNGLASTQGTSHNQMDSGGQPLVGIGTNEKYQQ